MLPQPFGVRVQIPILTHTHPELPQLGEMAQSHHGLGIVAYHKGIVPSTFILYSGFDPPILSWQSPSWARYGGLIKKKLTSRTKRKKVPHGHMGGRTEYTSTPGSMSNSPRRRLIAGCPQPLLQLLEPLVATGGEG